MAFFTPFTLFLDFTADFFLFVLRFFLVCLPAVLLSPSPRGVRTPSFGNLVTEKPFVHVRHAGKKNAMCFIPKHHRNRRYKSE